MADFDNLGDDNMVDYIRGRCNTWPRSQLKPADSEDQLTTYSHFSPLTPPEYSSELSLINESNESIHNSLHNSADFVQWSPNNCSSIKLTSTPSVTNYKAGHPSYVELITQAILSSPEKRMTLSEIYDWMVTNVDAFKDQRQLPCSTGWKVLYILLYIQYVHYYILKICCLLIESDRCCFSASLACLSYAVIHNFSRIRGGLWIGFVCFRIQFDTTYRCIVVSNESNATEWINRPGGRLI